MRVDLSSEKSGAVATDRLILLGRVCGTHGVRGELKLESHTAPRAAIFRYQPWILRDARGERTLDGVRGSDNGRNVLACFPGVEDREQAQALIGTEIWVPRGRLPALPEGEYYWVDLEGMAVETLDGVPLGTVSHLFSTGANDVLVVRGERERLLPFVHGDCVREVDLGRRRIMVDWDPDF